MEVRPSREVGAVSFEYLDAVVLSVGHVEQAVGSEGDDVRRVELARFGAVATPVEEKPAVGGELCNARIAVAIGDKKFAARKHADMRGLEKMGGVAAGDAVDPEREQQFSFGGKLHDDVPAHVGDPDVVPRIDVQAV